MFRRRLGFLAALAAAFAGGALLASLPEAGAKDKEKEDPGAAAPAAVRAFFSPGGEIEPALLDAIKDAKQEIVVAMYNFTSRPLAEALGRAKARGVDVRAVIDRSQAFVKHAKTNDLRRAKVAVRLMTLGKTGDDQQIRFHHKFMVIDREVVTTGSYNWTSQADESNYENELVLHSKKLASEFRETFEKCWEKAEDDTARKSASEPPPPPAEREPEAHAPQSSSRSRSGPRD